MNGTILLLRQKITCPINLFLSMHEDAVMPKYQNIP